jgi:ribonuclease HI
MKIQIWTDGGCSGNPGPGGWAFVIVDESGAILAENKGGERGTTNNRMELLAVISALNHLEGAEFAAAYPAFTAQSLVVVYTDSQYVQKGISEWIKNWKKNGWLTANKKPVKNAELWRALDEAADKRQITWKWVKGHAGTALNERCDRMTGEAIEALRR